MREVITAGNLCFHMIMSYYSYLLICGEIRATVWYVCQGNQQKAKIKTTTTSILITWKREKQFYSRPEKTEHDSNDSHNY